VIHGTPDFFEITKKLHNALQGNDLSFSSNELELYQSTNEKFARFAMLDHDFAVIHDPQPCALVSFFPHTRSLGLAVPHRPDKTRGSSLEIYGAIY
jgi:trehalose synthase